MLQDGKSMKSALPTDIEGLAAQFSRLREDLANLTHSVTANAERRDRQIGLDISDGVGVPIHYVERKGKGAEAELEKTVTNHPLPALGLAAAFGLVIGAMTRR